MKVKCPQCRKITEWENNPFRPFCSERCKLIDLGYWIEGRYSLKSEDDGLEEGSYRKEN